MRLSLARLFKNVEWAPLQVPMVRRLETFAAAASIFVFVFSQLAAIIITYKLLYSRFWWLITAYIIWMLSDIDACNQGGRPIEYLRNWAWWRYYRNYFPVKLVKTTELDASRNYLFACFPHGVVACGPLLTLACNSYDFTKLFPNMTSQMATLRGNFLVPFVKDWLMSLGIVSCSKESLSYLLNRRRYKGKCVALVVGGAAESMLSRPGEYKVVLKNRKGFIRVAIENGAPIVPVIAFGEPELFRTLNAPKGSYLKKFQEKVTKWTGVSPVLAAGRGVFQYTFGPLPLRKPVNVVVGAPMDLGRNPDPTDEEVDAAHAEFIKELINLFETEKPKYLENHDNVQLVIT